MKESWNRWRQFGLSCSSVSGVKEIVVAGSVMMTSVLCFFSSALGASYAISPTEVPAPSWATFLPSRKTSTSPCAMMWKLLPSSPLR